MKTNLLKAAIFTPTSRGRWGLPLVAWGSPGIAKSAVIEELCASFDMPCVVLSPGEMGEGAFGVVPVPTREGVIKYPPPEWTQVVAGGGVVFVDEIVCCPPAIAPALQGLLLEKRVGGHTLPCNVRLLAAANPPELATTGYELSAPNANRCGHLRWAAPSVDEWTAYMTRAATGAREGVAATLDYRAEEARVLAAWPKAWARAVGLSTAFLRAAPQHLDACPKPDDPSASRAWPSPRSWENATRALASADVHALSGDDTEELVAAFIGQGVASEWFEFVEQVDLPDAAALLDGHMTFKHEKARIDRTAAVLAACTSLVLGMPERDPKRAARANALWGVAIAVLDDKESQDVLVPTGTALVGAGLHAGPGLTNATKGMAKMFKLLDAAGVNRGGR